MTILTNVTLSTPHETLTPFNSLRPVISWAFCLLYLPVVRDQTLPQPQFPEDVHSDVHRSVVRHSERAQVHDSSETKRGRGIFRLQRSVLGEDHPRRADHSLLTLSGIV